MSQDSPGLRERLYARRYLACILLITLAAAALRLWHLGSIPDGLHGDEAWTGIDADRILRVGWIGPYVQSARGQPAGPLYWAALVLKLAGDGVFQVRLSMALLGIVTIPVVYIAGRRLFDDLVGLMAAALLACMSWHLLFSRSAFMVVSWPLAELGVMALLAAAWQTRQGWVYAAAGLVLGLGVYTYNVYPVFAAAIVLFAALQVWQAGEQRRAVLGRWCVCFGCALLAALPLIVYAALPGDGYFSHHESVSVFDSADFKSAGTVGKAGVVLDNAGGWLRTMLWSGDVDLTDGSGQQHVLDALTTVAAACGAIVCLRRFREPASQLLLTLLFVLPAGALLTTEAQARRTLGLAPVVALLAALALAELWRSDLLTRLDFRAAGPLAALSVLAAVSALNVATYFHDSESTTAKWVYAQQITAAVRYAEAQPGHPYVYFFSKRWRFSYETRRYLAPNLSGEDRSDEFGSSQSLDFDRAYDSLVLLLPPYTDDLYQLTEMYPDATVHSQSDGSDLLFIALSLPRLNDSAPAIGPQPPPIQPPQ